MAVSQTHTMLVVLRGILLQSLFTVVNYLGVAVGCPGLESNGVCLYIPYPDLRVPWREAETLCGEVRGTLAAVSSSSVHNQLTALLMAQAINDAWIGAKESEYMWRWIADESQIAAQGCFQNNPNDPILPNLQPRVDPSLETGADPNLSPGDPGQERDYTLFSSVECIETCKKNNFLFAGTMGGSQCACGSYTPARGYTSGCTDACVVRSPLSLWCGGADKFFIYYVAGSYGEWAYDQPNNFDGRQWCGVIDGNKSYKLADEGCHETKVFICIIPNTPCNVARHFRVSGRCYYISEERVSWWRARRRCRALGGVLADLPSADARQDLIVLLKRYASTDMQVWVGLTKARWKWSTGQEVQYVGWSEGEPRSFLGTKADVPSPADDPALSGTNTRGADRCVAVSRETSYLWFSQPCDAKLHFVCQVVTSGTGFGTAGPNPLPPVGNTNNINSGNNNQDNNSNNNNNNNNLNMETVKPRTSTQAPVPNNHGNKSQLGSTNTDVTGHDVTTSTREAELSSSSGPGVRSSTPGPAAGEEHAQSTGHPTAQSRNTDGSRSSGSSGTEAGGGTFTQDYDVTSGDTQPTRDGPYGITSTGVTRFSSSHSTQPDNTTLDDVTTGSDTATKSLSTWDPQSRITHGNTTGNSSTQGGASENDTEVASSSVGVHVTETLIPEAKLPNATKAKNDEDEKGLFGLKRGWGIVVVIFIVVIILVLIIFLCRLCALSSSSSRVEHVTQTADLRSEASKPNSDPLPTNGLPHRDPRGATQAHHHHHRTHTFAYKSLA